MQTVVLVEGVSDEIAVCTLAARIGRDLEAEDVAVMPMGGATNIRPFLDRITLRESGAQVAGLCDEREQHLFRATLDHVFVCVADLEDELIRALGSTVVEDVIDAQGELASFRIMQKQPDQRERPLDQQLRRFMGTRSGRKMHYARVLVEALDLDRVPPPLDDLLNYV